MHKNITLRIICLLSAAICMAILATACSGVKLTQTLRTNTEEVARIKSMSRLDHKVILMPAKMEIITDGKSKRIHEKDLAIEPDDFSDRLIESFQSNNVFKSIEKSSTPITASKRLQLKEARNKKGTLIMNVSFKTARVYYVGKNDSVFGNTFLWLLLGVPSLWGADLDYGVEIIADVSFLDIASSPDFATAVSSFECSFQSEGGLNYLERSSSIAIVIMPPQFCPDNLEKVEKLVLSKAINQFLIQLAEQTKKEFGK
jgi:hypothetical protein